MKKLTFLAAIFLGLALFVYFYEIKGGEEREKQKEIEESLFRVEEESVTRIEITRQAGDSLVLEKEGDGWLIRAPVEASADRFAVDALVRDVVGARRERTLSSIDNVDQYGLGEPRVLLKLQAGEKSASLKIGKEDYTGNQVYAQFEGDPKILLTPKAILTSADKEVFEFRDKNVLSFEQDQIRAVELVRPAGRLDLNKRGSEWWIERPIEDDADSSSVSDLLSTVRFARVERFAAEQVGDPSEYGLDKPGYVLRVREEGSDQWKTLEIGSATENGYFARSPDRTAIVVVKEALVEKLSQDVWEFRGKKVVSLAQDDVERFRMVRREEELVIVRAGNDWLIEAPEAQKEKKTATYKFWYPVTDIVFETISEGKSAESDPVYAAPGVTIELTTKQGEAFQYDFVAEGDTYRARRRASGKHGTITKDQYDKLALQGENLVTE